MRDYIFHGKIRGINKWVEGTGIFFDSINTWLFNHDSTKPVASGMEKFIVEPESVGQYTGMNEFVASDKSFNRPLFEGDIVEVWSNRSPKYTRVAKSQYDGDVVVRATICFRRGSWTLDYDNKYNEAIARLRGKEEDERAVNGYWELYSFGPHNSKEEWLREHGFKWHDIKKIGNVYDNAYLLEG